MGRIPKAERKQTQRITKADVCTNDSENKILFSFKSIEKNEYFNLDATCQNWAKDLFDTMQIVSEISLEDIYSGKYSGKSATFRIHQHQDAKAPCKLPKSVSLDDMWQIRISKSKGGIHGIIRENVFYVIWFDPLHNLYPDDNYGGLRRINPAKSCCKDRDDKLLSLEEENKELREENEVYKKIFEEAAIV